MISRTISPLSLLLAAILVPHPVQGQNASDLMRQALAAQAERLEGIENVSITQQVMGMDTRVYMETREVDGVPVLFPVSVTVAGITNPVPEEMAQADWASPFQDEWVDRAELEGEDVVDGHPVYVLAITDFEGLEIPGMPAGGNQMGEIRPISARFWMDKEGFLTRKAVMDMEGLRPDGSSTPVHMELFMEDYREVDGYVHPFTTRTVMEGVMEASNMDPDELRAQLDQMKAQLESMPEAQRAMLEGMLSAQIEQLESMLGGEGGMEMTLTVSEIVVNGGPPGGR